MARYQSSSSSETVRIGVALGHAILKRGPQKRATIVTLAGELGAGKTTFTKGLYKGLGSKAAVTSPTFIIIRRNGLRGKKAGFKNIFHADPYRLTDAKGLKAVGFVELLDEPTNVVVVEWPERAKGLLPKSVISVVLHHGKSEHMRTVAVKGITNK